MPNRGTPNSERAESDAMVDAALDLVFRHGLAGLTLRALAAQVGSSVAVIVVRLGAKDQLVEQVIDRAAQRDQALFDHWLAQAVPRGRRLPIWHFGPGLQRVGVKPAF